MNGRGFRKVALAVQFNIQLSPTCHFENSRSFMHTLFLAKLFPQLYSCNWNGNYDLFSNFVTFLALL